MKVSYYPGCSADGTAREYGESIESVARILDFKLEELKDWNCCGASPAHATSPELSIALSARNLEIAGKTGLDLIIPCASCFHQLKRAEKNLPSAEGNGKKGFNVKYIVDFIHEDVGEKAVKAKVKRPLTGLKPVCYYGCLATRPPEVTGSKNPEDPQAMDRLLKALGADVKKWSFKTDCCGGTLIFNRTDLAFKLVSKLLAMAEEAGADCIVTGCPLCQSNLDVRQNQVTRPDGSNYNMPIFYFTELMGLAFGEADAAKWLRRHLVDPRPLLRQKGLL